MLLSYSCSVRLSSSIVHALQLYKYFHTSLSLAAKSFSRSVPTASRSSSVRLGGMAWGLHWRHPYVLKQTKQMRSFFGSKFS